MTTSTSGKDPANRDPISGEPGAHPVGVGIGAAVGGIAGGVAAGAAAGTVAGGPIGTAVGAAVGAVVGGLGGKAVAEKADPTMGGHDSYWRENHAKQSYYDEGTTYDDYEPAYRLGSQPRTLHANKTFDEAEPHLAADYERMKGTSSLGWDKAKHAVRAAWDRVTEGHG